MTLEVVYYQCQHCLAVQYVEFAGSGSNFNSIYWTDCFEYTPLWIDKPKIIKCWNCGKLLWVEDLEEYSGETDNWYFTDRKQLSGFTINPDKPLWQDYAKLSQDDYHYILENGLYRETLSELEVRTLAFWARNDKYRYPDGWFDHVVYDELGNSRILEEVGPRIKDPHAGNLEFATPREIVNMEALLEMIAASDEEGYKLFQAELLRELGRFEEAIAVLDSISGVEGNWLVIIEAQRGLCAKQCTSVQIVEFPPIEHKAPSPEEIEKEKLEKEDRHQKWRAIVAKEKDNKRK